MTDREFCEAVEAYEFVLETYGRMVEMPTTHPRVQYALEMAICDTERRLIRVIGRGRTRGRYAVTRDPRLGWMLTTNQETRRAS